MYLRKKGTYEKEKTARHPAREGGEGEESAMICYSKVDVLFH